MQLQEINIEVVQKNVKNIRLSVHAPQGHVRVSAPKAMSLKVLHAFITSKLDWIRKQQKKFHGREVVATQRYIDDEGHYFRGECYALKVIEHKAVPRVELQDKTIALYVRPNATLAKRQTVLKAWYRAHLLEALSDLIVQYEAVMKVSVEKFGVKQMKSRWGSCNPRSRHVWFSLELAKKSPGCLEYVVVHELAHLLEPSHNQRFKSLMNTFMPDWRDRKKELNGK